MILWLKKQPARRWLLLGLACVAALYAPYLLAGGNAVYIAHDQYDGDMLNYVLQARHLFEQNVPEYMAGGSKTYLPMGAPLFVLLYAVLAPRAAFCLQTILIALAGYCGMFLWCLALTKKPPIACAVAVAFSMLPFYTVYGLSVMGQPLVFYCVCRIWRAPKRRLAYAGVALFGLTSSLVFIGYADVLFIVCLAAYAAFGQKDRLAARRVLLAGAVLCAVYAAVNAGLLAQLLFPTAGSLTHRAEWTLAPEGSVAGLFTQMLLKGQYHAASVHTLILLACVPAVPLLCVWRGGDERFSLLRRLFFLVLAACAGIAAFYALYNCAPGVALRNALGSLGSFQADRFYWLYPFLWYTLLALLLSLPFYAPPGAKRRAAAAAGCALWLVCAGYVVSKNSGYTQTVRRALGARPAVTSAANASWDDFFAPALFGELRAFLGTDTRVVSVGLCPSVAVMNGIPAADGYLSNYPLAYKHAFRRVVAPELAKSDTLYRYFNDWGNRCYVFSAELGANPFCTKDGEGVIHALDLDTQALAELGVEYMLCAVPIERAHGLTQIADFTRGDSVYHIYVYRVDAAFA